MRVAANNMPCESQGTARSHPWCAPTELVRLPAVGAADVVRDLLGSAGPLRGGAAALAGVGEAPARGLGVVVGRRVHGLGVAVLQDRDVVRVLRGRGDFDAVDEAGLRVVAALEEGVAASAITASPAPASPLLSR